MHPDKHKFVKVKKPFGEVEQRQKRLRLMSVKEVQALFLETGLSCFKALRQPEVCLVSSRDQEVYMCIYCENFKATVIGFQKVAALPKWEELVKSTMCLYEEADNNCRKWNVQNECVMYVESRGQATFRVLLILSWVQNLIF